MVLQRIARTSKVSHTQLELTKKSPISFGDKIDCRQLYTSYPLEENQPPAKCWWDSLATYDEIS